MEPFPRRGGRLHAEGVPLEDLARALSTPLYVYSANELRRRARAIRAAFEAHEPLVCYSVKSNGNLAVLALLAAEGLGFDIVSGGELHRVRRAGGDPARVVFAGVGKTDAEIREALAAGVHSFNVESEGELRRLDAFAREAGTTARAALRINPAVAADTHAYVATGHAGAKFGVSLEAAAPLLVQARTMRGVRLEGLHAHVGSQIFDASVYRRVLDRLAGVGAAMPGGAPAWVDLGGGFGVDYEGGPGLRPESVAEAIGPGLAALRSRLVLEPGRWISGPAGLLLTRVIDVKRTADRTFAVVDAGMNDLLRPALYGAVHRIVPVVEREGARERTDVVGPVCETGDFLGVGRDLPRLEPGDLVAVLDAGAYGFSMASQYNGRPRAAEALVAAERWRLARARETVDDLARGEDPDAARV